VFVSTSYLSKDHNKLNPLPPSDSETKKKINLEDLFSSVFSKFKKYHPSGNLKFNNLGIFQSLKLRNLMGKILRISLRLYFTPNTLDGYGLREWLFHAFHQQAYHRSGATHKTLICVTYCRQST